MSACAVFWCLDKPWQKKPVCKLHYTHPVKHSKEDRRQYFIRLREEGVNLEYRKRIRTRTMRDGRLFDSKTIEAEPGLARPGFKG